MRVHVHRWSIALLAGGGAVTAGGGLLVAKLVSEAGGTSDPYRAVNTSGPATARPDGTGSSNCRVQVVAVSKRECDFEERVRCWDAWVGDMTTAAHAGAIAEDNYVKWLANIDVASSSAQAARDFALSGDDGDGNDGNDDDEAVFFFYLCCEGKVQGCMQVRIASDIATIDALCSLGNHSGEAFMRHLMEWLPTAAPRVTHIHVMPLSDGWLRQGYYARLGFASHAQWEGSRSVCGVMTREVETYSIR